MCQFLIARNQRKSGSNADTCINKIRLAIRVRTFKGVTGTTGEHSKRDNRLIFSLLLRDHLKRQINIFVVQLHQACVTGPTTYKKYTLLTPPVTWFLISLWTNKHQQNVEERFYATYHYHSFLVNWTRCADLICG